MGSAFENRFQARTQCQCRLSGAGLAAEGDDSDRLVEQQIQRDPLFGGSAPQSEHLAVTAHKLDALIGIDSAQGVRGTTEQSNSGVAGHVSRVSDFDLALGEESVDLFGRYIEFGHACPAGSDHILGVVLISGQTHGAGFDPKRDVLADQRDSFTLGGQVGRTGQNPGIIGIGPEAGRQHRRITVVELDVQGAALSTDRQRLVETTVFQSQIIEEPQRLTGEPTQLVMVPLGFQFADHHQRNDHLMFGEPRTRPGVG